MILSLRIPPSARAAAPIRSRQGRDDSRKTPDARTARCRFAAAAATAENERSFSPPGRTSCPDGRRLPTQPTALLRPSHETDAADHRLDRLPALRLAALLPAALLVAAASRRTRRCRHRRRRAPEVTVVTCDRSRWR